MTARRGFTLIELLLAIVVTSVVALLVYGTVQVGLDAQERLNEHLAVQQTRRTARLLLADVLRNVRRPVGGDDSVFVLRPGRTAGGQPADELSIVTGATTAPLTAESDWLVSMRTTDSGLTLLGAPLGVRRPPRLIARLPGVSGVEVRVRRVSTEDEWSDRWLYQATLPAEVMVTFWSDSGIVAPVVRAALAAGGPR